jgi:transposase-like protein
MAIEMTCPTCGSHDISKNGMTRRGKQNHNCYDCGRQFVEDPQWQPKAKDTFGLVNLLLLEKIPLAGIARAAQVSNSCCKSTSTPPRLTKVASQSPKGYCHKGFRIQAQAPCLIGMMGTQF